MAGSLNKVSLIGNIGRDPEIRSTQDGNKIATFSVATSESWKNKDTGERKERTEWHRVVIFNEALAKITEQYIRKGSKVYLEGALQTRKWVDNNGAERYTTEIVLSRFRGELTMLDGRDSGSSSSMPPPASSPDDYGMNNSNNNPGSTSGGTATPGVAMDAISGNTAHKLSDDIPF